MLCLTEQGVYFFLGRSDKPKALPYQMWIAGYVVPSIRATGSYSVHHEDCRPAPVEEDKPKKPALPQHSGIIKAAEKIIHKAFKCKEEKDFQEVLALDTVFTDTFGVSALELAGLKLIRSTKLVEKPVGKMHFGGWGRYWEVPCFKWEHQYPSSLGDGH